MFKRLLLVTSYCVLVTALISGCVVRTYPLTKERVDQDLSSGNKGYIQGHAPSGETTAERKSTRTTQVVEIELRSPIKFEKVPKQAKQTEQAQAPQEATQEKETIEGNRGYVMKGEETGAAPSFEKYTVQKGDTLQKISQKFFGTTKNWLKIYNANKDTLKGPNKVYPGQILNIPAEPGLKTQEKALKEPKGNLK